MVCFIENVFEEIVVYEFDVLIIDLCCNEGGVFVMCLMVFGMIENLVDVGYFILCWWIDYNEY